MPKTRARAFSRLAHAATRSAPSRAGFWREIEARLAKGAASEGVKLSPAECRALREIVGAIPKRPRGRPREQLANARARHIAALTTLLELAGCPSKVAVAEAMREYGVGRTTVTAARRRWRPFFFSRLRDAKSEVRDAIFRHIQCNRKDYWIIRWTREMSRGKKLTEIAPRPKIAPRSN
jgi:hypothetical protein